MGLCLDMEIVRRERKNEVKSREVYLQLNKITHVETKQIQSLVGFFQTSFVFCAC